MKAAFYSRPPCFDEIYIVVKSVFLLPKRLAGFCLAFSLSMIMPHQAGAAPWLEDVLAHHVASNDLLYATLLVDTPAGSWTSRHTSPAAQQYLAETPLPDEGDTRYRLGEIAHIFLALTALSMEQAGSLDLATPLRKHLSGDPFSGIKNIQKAALADLITQSAAIVDYSDNSGFYRRILSGKKTEPWSRLALLKLMPALDAYDEPGKSAWISKGNDLLLAMMLERDSGQSWPALLQEHVLTPLALQNTGAGAEQPNLLPGFQDIDETEDNQKERLDTLPMGQNIPGRDMASNARDLATLVRWLATDKSDIAHEYRALASRTLDGAGTGLQISGDGDDTSYALFGHQPGWQAEARHHPESGITIVLQSAGNATPERGPALLELLKKCNCLTPDLPSKQ